MSTSTMSRLSDRMSMMRQQVGYFSDTNFVEEDYNNVEMLDNMCRSETIHSGHFMVSEIDDLENGDKTEVAHESDYEQPDTVNEERGESFDFELPLETTQKYCYGPESSHTVTIDASLSKLFKCMSLAYSGKLTSPKWKTFKGLKLKLKDKIRLNNIIWRAWHIQYIISRKPAVCQFASLVDCDSHNKPEAVVLEGKYWKRRLATVTAEYQKWRLYHKEKSCVPHRLSFAGLGDSRWIDWNTNPLSVSCSSQIDDDFVMDFNDTTLFNSLLPPNVIDFPNPREIARSGFGADFIQPGLTQLQPTFDDYMDLDYFLTSRTPSVLPPLLEESTSDQSSNVVKQQPGTRKLNSEENADFLSGLETIVCPTETLQNPSPFVNTAPVSEQPISKISDAISLTNENQFLRNNSCAQTVQSLSAICPLIQSPNEVQNTNEVPILSLDYSKTSEIPFDYKWKDQNTLRSNESEAKIVPQLGVLSNSMTNKFAMPKQPFKQRTRSRSISSPQTNEKQIAVSVVGPSLSLTDVTISKANVTPVERCSSLPVYNQRRNAIGPLLNAQLMQQQQLQNSQNGATKFQINSVNYLPLATDIPTTTALQVTQPPVNTEANSLIAQLLSSGSSATRISRANNVTHFESRPEVNNNQSDPVTFEVPLNMKRKSGTSSKKYPNDSHVTKDRNQRSAVRVPDVFTSTSYSRPPQPLNSAQPASFSITPVSSVSPNTNNSQIVNSFAMKTVKSKSDRDRLQYKEHRRVCHINAEQKRRFNIKNGFDTLRSILPSVNQNSSTKISKAAMLQKAAEHIRTLKTERQQQQEEHEMLTKQIESLNTTISVFQGQLPATGAPFSCQRTGQIKENFDAYVEERIMKNWKFWIFSIIMKPMLESYNNTVTTTNVDDMTQSVLRWLDQNCTLLTLRPNAIAALRQLSTSTNILTNPSSLPEEILEFTSRKPRQVP
ncbi:MLX-interacting protein-like protein [Leptotrombidium deliense]|uniref:MLX-interacting protein-like protein n=1 Tax=Leptotrombidium deliense TaxID=299467 RepID=A0A443SE74_9ACAR|nr:MLX-interacting protein-like protein [Leptotrombidium deliense]